MWEWNRQMWEKKKRNHQMWEKKKESPNVRKKTVTCNVGIAQCEEITVKCEKKVTWYSRLSISGYCTPFFGGYHRITLVVYIMSVLNLFIKLFYITIFYYYIKYKYSIYTPKNNLTIILFLFCSVKKQTLYSTKAHICVHKWS